LSVAGNDKVSNPLGGGVERRVVDLAVQAASGRPVPKDRLIGDLASRQYGVVARSQLLSMGIGAGAIETRLRQHYLHRLHRGVYAVGHLALVPLAREMAAVLACGAGASAGAGAAAGVGVAHRSAAVVWYLRAANDDAEIDVIVRGAGGRRRPGIRIHRSTSLAPQDIRHLRGLPVTTPGRTLIDLAESATDRELERATHEAITRRLLNARRLLSDLGQYRGRRGIGRLRELLERGEAPTITRSEAEERFLALVRAAGLPSPEVNVRIHGHEVDFLWREQGLVVEVDGFQFHSTRDAFERDRRRDAHLQGAGLRVLRVTWRQVVELPYATLTQVVRALVV
jgi:very-short-patch-repair endonuclease